MGTSGQRNGFPNEPLRMALADCGRVADGWFSYGILEHVTAREQLHELVDVLDDEQATRALSVLSRLAGRVPGQRSSRRRPASLGHAGSGRSDLSERVEEILAEGFGR
jgi:hypothetical protein